MYVCICVYLCVFVYVCVGECFGKNRTVVKREQQNNVIISARRITTSTTTTSTTTTTTTMMIAKESYCFITCENCKFIQSLLTLLCFRAPLNSMEQQPASQPGTLQPS